MHGTTQHVHTIEIPVGEQLIHFHDNPGHFSYKRETARGLSRGNYGIIVISVQDLANNLDVLESFLEDESLRSIPSQIREYVVPLYIAIKLGVRVDTIVLSKFDLVNYDKNIYDVCTRLLLKFFKVGLNYDESQIVVIPTAIDVNNEKSHNVVDVSQQMPWYSGSALLYRLSTLVSLCSLNESGLFFPVQKHYTKVTGHKLILSGKVVRGTIHGGDMVKIAPFPEATNLSVDARIRSIHYDLTSEAETPQVPRACEGNIVALSMSLSDSYIKRLTQSKKVPYFIFSKGTRLCYGDVLSVTIPESEQVEQNEFDFLSKLELIINGKYYPAHYIGIDINSSASSPSFCFAMNCTVSAIIDGERLIGLNPLLYIEKPKNRRHNDIKIIATCDPIHNLGFLSELYFNMPNDIYTIWKNLLSSFIVTEKNTPTRQEVQIKLNKEMLKEIDNLRTLKKVLKKERADYEIHANVKIDRNECVAD